MLTMAPAPAGAALTPQPCPDCHPPAATGPGNSPYVFSTAFACDPATGMRQWTVRFGVGRNTVVPKHKVGNVVVPAHKPASVTFSYIVTNTSQLNQFTAPLKPGQWTEVAVRTTAALGQPVELDVLGYETGAPGGDTFGYVFFDKTLQFTCTCDQVASTTTVPPTTTPATSTSAPGPSLSPRGGPGTTLVAEGAVQKTGNLPATGPSHTVGLVGGGIALAFAGGLLVWSMRRKETGDA